MIGDQMYMRLGVWCWKRDWSAAEEERLKRAFEGGASDAEIGKRLRRSDHSVQRKRLKLGLRRARGSQPWPPERLAKARALREGGWSSYEIARYLGVTRNMVIGALWRAAA